MTVFQDSTFGVNREKNLHILPCITHTFLSNIFEGKIRVCVIHGYNDYVAWV